MTDAFAALGLDAGRGLPTDAGGDPGDRFDLGTPPAFRP